MNMNSSSASIQTWKLAKKSFFADFYKNILLKRLSGIVDGQIQIITPSETIVLGKDISAQHISEPLCVQIKVVQKDFFAAIVLGGSVGAAESYMQGDWTCNDLTSLVRILVRNSALLDEMEGGLASLAAVVMRSAHSLRKNTRSGSRKNIAEHYDLGNDLFEHFLDKDWMMYSSALYKTADDTLEQAQARKLQSLCEKLHLSSVDHLLEIGTGWGGCAVYAAQHYGCRVTTTTISKEQYYLAIERVNKAGLENKITVLLEDYRDLQGSYDKLVSIEMVEAVGHQFVGEYFNCCSNLLKEDGIAVIQAITIEDHRYEQALKSVDFIKRYIFPGSFIPSVSVLTNAAGNSQLRLNKLEDIGYSYALTLREWRKRFMKDLEAVKAQGYSDEFIRMWEFYLCYCEGGFIERSISDVHMQFVKPGNRCASDL
jgi:cyclopropane-fatty-acyl-phospholipid synthase